MSQDSQAVGSGWDVPKAVSEAVDFHWFHVRPGRELVLVMLSPGPLWYVGHFEGKRMSVCRGPECGACDRGIGKQLRYVVCAIEPATRQKGVIELSKPVALMLRDWSGRNGGFRGMMVGFTKASSSKHSRMEVSYIPERAPAFCLAQEPYDLSEVMKRTWERMG